MGTGGVVPVVRGMAEEGAVAAVCAVLQPYEWRSFTPDLLARCLLGALDRQRVLDLLLGVPGVRIGDPEPAGLAEPGDPRVPVLVGFLTGHQWQGLTLLALCRQLLRELQLFCTQRQRFDAELDRLVEGDC